MKTTSPPSRPNEPAEAINRHLGSRVKQLRAGRGWSLEALANASGVSRSMLSQIEREEASYRADVPHAILNSGRGEATLFLIVIYR